MLGTDKRSNLFLGNINDNKKVLYHCSLDSIKDFVIAKIWKYEANM
jgi:hypothetical protein